MFWFCKDKEKQKSKLLQKANNLYRKKKYKKSIEIYQEILKIDSKHFASLANIATAYFELQEYALSIPFFQQTIKADSSNPWWYNYLSQSAQKIGDSLTALEAAWNAVLLSNNDDSHHLNMAYTIYEISDEQGRKNTDIFLTKWYNQYPQNPIAKQCYKSFFYDKDFTSSEPEYVEKLFDVFASDFDNVLAELNYDSPKIIAENLYEFIDKKTPEKMQILDIGCGSGLCGFEIKKLFPKSQIIGVDISSQMLQKAAEKNIYSKLIKSEINDYFSNCCDVFDVVVASDVLTYFGCLDSLFDSVKNVLSFKGVFVFTISTDTTNKYDYFLMPSSRFVHSEKYIEKIAEQNNFKLIQKQQKILRTEGEKNINGTIYLLQKK